MTMRWSAVGCIMTLTLSFLAAPLAAGAQQAGRIPRIGLLWSGAPSDPYAQAFRQGLQELGYVEGKSIVLEDRSAEGRPDRLPTLAAELVRLQVDVILAAESETIRAAWQATKTIPIVMATSGDPVGLGVVASLAHPGGNVTGLSSISTELAGKRLELLKGLVPGVTRVAFVWNPDNPVQARMFTETEVAARSLGVQLQSLKVRGPSELDGALSAMTQERAGALIVVVDLLLFAHMRRIADLAVVSRLPAIAQRKEFAEAGGLMTYGPSYAGLFRRAATYVDKILKGAKPADLPVEQPTKFELVLNLKTAKALGLTIPPSVLFQADEVIQ
jgi:putative ABC transport system substrate-binding protein